MLTRPVGGGGVCNWTKTGNDIYYTAGKVGIGTAAPAYDFHIQDKYEFHGLTQTAYSASVPQDQVTVFKDYKGVQAPGGGYGFLGNTFSVVTYHESNGATKPVGISNGLVTLTWMKSNGNVYSEATPFWVGLTSDEGGRLWGTDRNVNGPKQTQTQCDLLMGDSLVVNNYNSSPINMGGWGAVICTKPGGGGMLGFTGRTSLQTYPLDALLVLCGWSGFGNRSVETSAAIKALQIGGGAGGWISKWGDTSKFDYGIDITDWVTNGIIISGRKTGATGADIKCTGILQIGDYTSITPDVGMLRYTVTSGFQGYHGGVWAGLGGGGSGDVDGGSFTEVYTYTANIDAGAF